MKLVDLFKPNGATNVEKLLASARAFEKSFDQHKSQSRNAGFTWYPYGTLNNFQHFTKLFQDAPDTDILALAGGKPIADIGAADGDTAFFLESLGHQVDAIDYAPSNYNSCQGIRFLKNKLNSSIGILETDLDAKFELPSAHYGLAFFLGILYHLKNPYGALEQLSKMANYALISTRIAKFNVADNLIGAGDVNNSRMRIETIPSAYLVAPTETNNDSTNYWMFTDAGLKRLIDRCGWDIQAYVTLGDTRNSDPASANHDERAFALLRSRSAVEA